MAEIEFRDVTRSYPGGVTALKGLNLTVADGEFLILVGPSGCGKSTALRLLAGLDKPSSGEIRIGGTVVNDLGPGQRDIAMVFQNYALYPHMTVYRNLAYGLKQRKTPRAEIDRRVRETAELLATPTPTTTTATTAATATTATATTPTSTAAASSAASAAASRAADTVTNHTSALAAWLPLLRGPRKALSYAS